LATDSSTSVCPPIATPGGVSASSAPIFSLTTKWGVGLGGRVRLALELVELVLDELVAGAADAELLDVLALALDVEEDVVAGAGVEALPVDELEAGAVVDVELEWLLEPHAATSNAGTSATPIRFSIARG
jgi:hypothetical protein